VAETRARILELIQLARLEAGEADADAVRDRGLYLAGRIMELTEREAGRGPEARVILGVALGRALAGYMARLALDHGEGPDGARLGMWQLAAELAEVAAGLVEDQERRLLRRATTSDINVAP